jgi:ParB/RepB/Spo0J family partition protein
LSQQDPIHQQSARRLTFEVVMKGTAWFAILAQIRQMATDPDDIKLTESILQHGVLQPLGARASDGRLIWGHRRLRCAKAAGLTEVPTVLLHKDMSEGEFLTLQILENVHRADLRPYDMWQGCARLVEANKGWKLQDVAKALSIDPASVTRIMSPSKAIPPVVEALKAGKIGLSSVYAITKGGSPEEQERLLNLSLAGTSRDVLEKEARRSRIPPSPAPSTVKLSRIRYPLSTGTTVVVSGPEMDIQALIDALSSALDAAKRASKESLDVKTAERVWKDKAKAG